MVLKSAGRRVTGAQLRQTGGFRAIGDMQANMTVEIIGPMSGARALTTQGAFDLLHHQFCSLRGFAEDGFGGKSMQSTKSETTIVTGLTGVDRAVQGDRSGCAK